jgi:exopolysaccharide production protein ExoZ
MERGLVQKYYGLQAVRLLAAVLVVAYHATSLASEQLGGVQVWKKGGYGIDLFFVLSGFVIVWSASSLSQDPDGWLIFAERRLVRVVPMYWLATTLKAIAVLVAGSMVVHARLTVWTFVASYLFIPCRNLDANFMPILGVGWTLNYEMFFYALKALALFLRINVFRFVGIILALLSVGS